MQRTVYRDMKGCTFVSNNVNLKFSAVFPLGTHETFLKRQGKSHVIGRTQESSHGSMSIETADEQLPLPEASRSTMFYTSSIAVIARTIALVYGALGDVAARGRGFMVIMGGDFES